MKQIKDNKYLSIKQTAWDGGAGIIRLPRNNKTGFTKATIIWSWGMDWEHVSVCPFNGSMPTWDDMCFIKDMFWNEEDCVIQYHPPKSEYVNNMPNCLHLWKPIKETIPMPPSILTGIKNKTFSRKSDKIGI